MSKRVLLLIAGLMTIVNVAGYVFLQFNQESIPRFHLWKELLLALNFPLIILLSPVGIFIDWAGSLFGVDNKFFQITAIALFTAAAPFFWYCVLSELCLRMKGSSLIAPNSRSVFAGTTAAMIILGLGVILYALLRFDLSMEFLKTFPPAIVLLGVWGVIPIIAAIKSILKRYSALRSC